MKINLSDDDQFDVLACGEGHNITVEVKRDEHGLVRLSFQEMHSHYCLADIPDSELLRLATRIVEYLTRHT